MKDLILKSMTEVISEGKKMPASSPLFKSLWHTGEVAFLVAESGIGKTILATQIACQVAKARKVLYLDFELTAKQIADRYSDEKTVYSFPKKFYMKLLNGMSCTDAHRMQDEVFDLLEEAITKDKIKIFVIDNLTTLCGGNDTTKNAVAIMNKLNTFKKCYGASFLVLAHTSKRRDKFKPIEKENMYGSSRFINLADSVFAMGCSSFDKELLYIKQLKTRQRTMEFSEDNVLCGRIQKKKDFLCFVEEGNVNERDLLVKEAASKNERNYEIFRLHKKGMSNREIGKYLGICEGTVRYTLNKNRETA